MRDRKLVSVITATWGRHALLMEAIENVRAQTYRPLEHVIVSDGQDKPLRRKIYDIMCADAKGEHPEIIFGELGFHTTAELADSYSAAPMNVAMLLARGEYQSWLADDERMSPDHIATIVDALEEHDVDFCYPRFAYYQWHDLTTTLGVGCSPPVQGSITTMVYRREMIDKAGGPYRTHVGRGGDWEFIERAMQGGATHHFVDRVTFSHRDDFKCPPELYAAPLPEYAK